MFKQAITNLKTNDLASSAFILLLLVLLLHLTQVFSRVDNLIYDLGQRFNVGQAPADVIIVAVDEDSLSQLGRWPWSRKTHADLLNRLSPEKPAAVGFDVIFSEPEQASPDADSKLAQAIKSAGNVVLPVLVEPTRMNGQMIEILPMPALIEGAADLGRVHAVLDQDSIARSVYLYEGVGTPAWQLFAQAVINVAQKSPSKNNFKQDRAQLANLFASFRKDQRRIHFFGPSGYFYRISYAQVLAGDFSKGLFKDKIVLIGATAFGMGDLLTTPVSGLAQPMAGVEFHANVLESIRKDKLIVEVPLWLSTIMVMILALLPLLWIPKLSALAGLVVSLFLVAMLALFAGLLPHLGYWIPPSAALSALLLAYPIWSWRKLSAAQRFLDAELDYLRQNLKSPVPINADLTFEHYDKFDSRIEQVKAASEQLRYLQNDRKETLAFISHDLRAPLASALMTLEQLGTQHELPKKLHPPLQQALNLAEDFLQASRAEVLDIANFSELDFAGLVHQCVDGAYDVAQKKEIALKREIFDGVVWVQGNFGLLERALLNLILNAVKYSPAQSQIIVRLRVDLTAKHAIFSVTNSGSGISIEQQTQLFKRFSRVKGSEQLAEGTGLGLYFVKTVAEKHQGAVAVESNLGEPTTFLITLPIISIQTLEA